MEGIVDGRRKWWLEGQMKVVGKWWSKVGCQSPGVVAEDGPQQLLEVMVEGDR